MENNRNFFITIAISVAILVLWQVFYMNPRIEAQREAARIEQEQAQTQQAEQPGATPAPARTSHERPGQGPAATVPAAAPQAAATTREPALAASSRIKIDTPRIAGSINLVGGRIADLILKDYRTTV